MDDRHIINNFPLLPSPPSPLLCWNNHRYNCWSCLSDGKVEHGEENLVEQDLRKALLYATIELEATRMATQEQLVKMEMETSRLRTLVETTTAERDEARHQFQQALLLLHTTQQQQQQLQLQHQHSKVTDTIIHSIHPQVPLEENGISVTASALSEESSIVSSPPSQPELDFESILLASKKELPEKGRLLEAVMKAGPLLKNLLLAGSLPQWRHPPPPLPSFEIPPVSIGVASTNTAAKTEARKQQHNKKRKDREEDMAAAVRSSGLSQSSPSSSSWSTPPNSSKNKYQSNCPLVEAVDYYH